MNNAVLMTSLFFLFRSLITYSFSKFGKIDWYTQNLIEYNSYLDFASFIIIFIIYLFVK